MRIVWGDFMAGAKRELLIDKGHASTHGEQIDAFSAIDVVLSYYLRRVTIFA